MIKKNISFISKTRKWATKHKLFGPNAFLRYIMFVFLERLNKVSNDFVFKGGNLLWFYIQTPRATIDLDFITLNTDSHEIILNLLETACSDQNDLIFHIESFEVIESAGKSGAKVKLGYETSQGARNVFNLDIVYCIATDYIKIPSITSEDGLPLIRASTIENIFIDKISSISRFKGGNTRMKDVDDLWRLSKSKIQIKKSNLIKQFELQTIISKNLLLDWINEPMEKAWKNHVQRYPDLPNSLEKTFNDINLWLGEIL